MKQKSIVKYIVIAVILIIALALIFFFVYNTKKEAKNKPEGRLESYMSYIEEEKYDEMYDMITDASKNSISKENFIARNKNIYSAIEVKNIKISNITEESLENRRYKTFIHKWYGYNCRTFKFYK